MDRVLYTVLEIDKVADVILYLLSGASQGLQKGHAFLQQKRKIFKKRVVKNIWV
jgi:hypothetical protein